MAVMLLAFTLVFVAIAVRLVTIQAVSADHYLAVGLSQRLTTTSLPGQRGTIFDRTGQDLAVSVSQTTLWADPQLVTDPQGEAAILAPVLAMDATSVAAKLRSAGQFVFLDRRVDDALAARVLGLKLAGVFGMPEPKRFQPGGAVGLPLLGSVGSDENGLSGLEAEYNQQLAGPTGQAGRGAGPQGKPDPGRLPPVPGPGQRPGSRPNSRRGPSSGNRAGPGQPDRGGPGPQRHGRGDEHPDR